MAKQSKATFQRNVWASYAGTDKNLVYQLTKYIAQKNDECRFTLNTYLVGDDGTPLTLTTEEANAKITADDIEPNLVSFLQPGQRIDDLIRTIGGNLRRALFISEPYLKSTYCLKELMCCLIRKPTSKIFVVTIDLKDGFDNALLKTKRTYSDDRKDLTIAEILTELYLHVWDKTDCEFRLTAKSKEDVLDYFTKQLTDLQERIKCSSNPDNVDSEVQKVYKQLCIYVEKFPIEDQLKAIDAARSKRLKAWYATKLGKEIAAQDTSYEQLIEWLNNANSHVKELRTFCRLLKTTLECSTQKEHTKALQTIASILLTTFVPREFAAELLYNTLPNAPIRIAEPEINDHKARLNIYAALVAAFNYELDLGFAPENSYLVAKNQIELPPIGLEENPDKQYDLYSEISSIIDYDMPRSKPDEFNHADLRSEIRFYREKAGDKALTITASLSKFDTHRTILHKTIAEFLAQINQHLREGEPVLEFYILLLSYSTLQNVKVHDYLAGDITTALKHIFKDYT